MPYISKEDMYVYCPFHVTAVVCTCGLYAVVNKFTKCLITGCKQKKYKTLWIGIMSMCKRRRRNIVRLTLHQQEQCWLTGHDVPLKKLTNFRSFLLSHNKKINWIKSRNCYPMGNKKDTSPSFRSVRFPK